MRFSESYVNIHFLLHSERSIYFHLRGEPTDAHASKICFNIRY